MTWNYRLVRRKYQRITDGNDEYYFAVHEAHYDDKGRCRAITVDPIPVHGDTAEETKEAYEMMAEAFRKPVLDFDTIPEPDAENPVVPKL